MFWKLCFLASIVSVVLSTNIVVVRRLNPDLTKPPLADLFSNRQCSSSTWQADRSTCAGGRCCMCECLYDHPNVFMNRTSLRCMNYGEINRMSSANCQYSFRRPNEPLEVIPLTKVASGKIRFRNTDAARVDCAENSLSVSAWQYLDKNAQWENGKGTVFDVDFSTVVGLDSSKKDLTFLKWNAMIDTKYAGLIIKFSLSCAGRNVGCLLAKINGTFEYKAEISGTSATRGATTSPTSPGSTTESTQTSRTSPGSTAESTQASRTSPGSTTENTPTSRTFQGSTRATTEEPSNIRPSVLVVPGTDPSSTKKPPTPLVREQQQSSKARTANNFAIPAISAAVGLICLIVLVCLILVLYKRRKRTRSRKPIQEEGEPEADELEMKKIQVQDHIYAEPDEKQISDNPLYCTKNLVVEEQRPIMRRSKLDPLPSLPAADEMALLARET